MEAGRPPRKQPCFFSHKEPPDGGLAEGNSGQGEGSDASQASDCCTWGTEVLVTETRTLERMGGGQGKFTALFYSFI